MKYYLHSKKYLQELRVFLSTKLNEVYTGTFQYMYYSFSGNNWNLGLRESVIFSKVIIAALKEAEMRDELYTRWVNLVHGMELDPDINKGGRNNENGILYLAEYIMCLHKTADLNTQDKLVFETIVNNLRYQDAGVYNRGLGESTEGHKYYNPPATRRTISQDNITAISCGSYLMGNKEECKLIAQHGIRNFFVFNNIKPKIRFPLNPGNIPSWLALGGYTKWALVFLPFYIINFFITMCKPPANTSSKKLYLLELYTLKDVFGFGWLNKLLIKRMTQQYGKNYLHEIYSIYYLNEEHPLREITK